MRKCGVGRLTNAFRMVVILVPDLRSHPTLIKMCLKYCRVTRGHRYETILPRPGQ